MVSCACPTIHQWLPLLKPPPDRGKLCQVFVTPQGAQHIMRILGGRGFLLVTLPRNTSLRDPGAARGFLSTLAQENASA